MRMGRLSRITRVIASDRRAGQGALHPATPASPGPDALETGFRAIGAVGVLRADADGNCFYANDAGCRILGVSREDVLGRGWLRLLPDLERARAARVQPEATAAVSYRSECRFQRSDGSEIQLQVDWTPDVGAEGPVGGALCTILDVTAQRQIEREAREAHDTARRQLEEIELLYQNTPAALCVVDRDLRFVRVNRWMALVDQRSEQDHIGRTMEEVLPEASRSQAVAIARRALASGKPEINVEVHTISSRDPSLEHWWLVSCHPLRRDGDVAGLLAVLQNVTAIKRAELQAQRRLDELEALYRNSPVGLGLLDRELRYVRVNEVLARFNGKPVAEHLGRTPDEVIPHAASVVVPLLRRVLADGEPVRDLELRVTAPDDPEVEQVYVVTYDPVRTAEGAVVGLVGTVSDVTALKRAERDARTHLEEVESVYAHAPVGLALLDRELRFVRVNERLAALTGCPVAEHLGVAAERIVPETARTLSPIARRVLDTGESARGIVLRGEDVGTPDVDRTLRVSLAPVRGAVGEVIGIIVVVHDVSDLVRAQEEALAARREALERLGELEAIYRQAPVGIAFVDPQLRYVRANEVLARIHGRTPAEIAGQRVQDLIRTPSIRQQVLASFEEVLATGEAVIDEEVRARPSWDPEREHLWLSSRHPLRDAEGTLLGIIVVLHDVTPLQEAEQHAREAGERARARLEELELIYQNSPVGLAYVDAAMRYVRVNDLLARTHGCSVAEHIGRRMDEIAPDLADQLVPVFRKVLETGQPVLAEELRGAARWDPTHIRTWLTSWHPVKSGTHAVRGVIVVVKDVTALKRRQAELEEVKTRLAKAEHVASVGSWEWDIHEDQIWWSDELYALFGKERRSFVPDVNSFYDQVHPDDRSKLREQFQATLGRDEPYRVDFRVVRDDGSERLVRACAKLERAADGMPVRLFGTCQDITVRSDENRRRRLSPGRKA
jgi:PAS domain S-box-containing protein